MAKHISLRLAWHSEGWNGHICKKPCENGYCVGQYSYPGTHIADNRDLDFESEHAGESICKHPCKVPCGLSANAFGKEPIEVQVDTPSWWDSMGGADPEILNIPPFTACTWPYEAMYKNDVFSEEKGKQYDYEKRQKQAEEYFSGIVEGKSLVFYYSGYSNPFSENEENNYVITGISRIKKLDDFHYYPNASEEIRKEYAGAVVWQRPITSMYPDEGFCIPYWKYMENEEILEKLVLKPSNRSPFKYGSREVSDDDAIEIINQLIVIIDYLITIKDDTENWEIRKVWLNSLLVELWKTRGPFPGFAAVLPNLGLEKIISTYVNLSDEEEMKRFRKETEEFLNKKRQDIFGINFEQKEIQKITREFMLKDDEEQKLLLEVLPRFDLSSSQISNIISENRESFSIESSLKEILENPYIIFEQYIGADSDDNIPFYKIDNGILPSPDYGLEDYLDAGSGERLRAFCVDELNRIAAHSFGKAETIMNFINSRLERMPEWKQYVFKLKNFKVDEEILSKALHIREDKDGVLYLYLKQVFEDERIIESVFKDLAERPNISLRMTITEEKFKEKLKNENSVIYKKEKAKYEEILNNQAKTCMKIFNKPICVLSGAAGTGKTTVIKAIVENLERAHGSGIAFLLMAPTGKAAERIKNQTEKNSSTIHSFLASNGWLNDNMTYKRQGGSKATDVNTIIIDESSMIDLSLFAALLRAINWNNVQRLILVGDPNQLPPIGRGKVFSDTIAWLKANFPDNVGVLTDNIRQKANQLEGKGTGILDLAEVFIQEKQTENEEKELISERKKQKEELFAKILEKGSFSGKESGDVDADLGIYFWKDQDDLQDELKQVMIKDMESFTGKSLQDEDMSQNKLWQEAIKEDSKIVPEKIQIISPYRGEFYGTDMINTWFQKEFNSFFAEKYTIDGITYKDKVIQIVNKPKSRKAYVYNTVTRKEERAEVYNGEIGIADIHPFDYKYVFDPRTKKSVRKFLKQSKIDLIIVKFSNKTREGLLYNYKPKGTEKVGDNLELAYAISVHKSQGSEFDYVYIVIPKRDSHLLSMELLYTAITRAQKKVTVFLQEDISTLTSLGHIEKSAVRRINSSVFEFKPLPEEILYIQNWYSDKKVLSTLSEYFVRSKSEVIIANMLTEAGIEFKYEEPLYDDNGKMYLPDFTVKFRGEDYYWEHVGRLDLPDYKAHWEKKEKWYNENFPGRLLVTYETPDLSNKAKEIIETHK